MSDSKLNKEQVYDKLISPLMEEIIKVSLDNGIAMVASFAIPTEEDPNLCCSTCLPDGNGKNPNNHKVAFHILKSSVIEVKLEKESSPIGNFINKLFH